MTLDSVLPYFKLKVLDLVYILNPFTKFEMKVYHVLIIFINLISLPRCVNFTIFIHVLYPFVVVVAENVYGLLRSVKILADCPA